MNDPVFVPDASVLLKWSLDSAGEEDWEKALAIRQGWLADRHRIILPSMLRQALRPASYNLIKSSG